MKAAAFLFRWGVLLVLAGLFLFPLLWLVTASIKQADDFVTYVLLPSDWSRLTLGNYVQLIRDEPLLMWLSNSMFISGLQAAVQVTASSLCGFALARYQFAGKRLITILMLCVLALPWQAMLPATYELMRNWGWVNTFAAVILPGAVSAFGSLMYRQAFASVPQQLIDAARIDGAGEWRVWWQICLPIVRPTTAALVLMSFLGAWNSLIWPAVILQSEEKFPLAVALANLQGLPEYQVKLPMLLAAVVVAILPPMAVFFICQKEFVSGLSAGIGRSEGD
jgi:ABC-type glycerol-3-phosphate transport system permease component